MTEHCYNWIAGSRKGSFFGVSRLITNNSTVFQSSLLSCSMHYISHFLWSDTLLCVSGFIYFKSTSHLFFPFCPLPPASRNIVWPKNCLYWNFLELFAWIFSKWKRVYSHEQNLCVKASTGSLRIIKPLVVWRYILCETAAMCDLIISTFYVRRGAALYSSMVTHLLKVNWWCKCKSFFTVNILT